MDILLVNPNRFRNPPVIPIGLEYIASALERDGKHSVKVLDLCFSEKPGDDLREELRKNSYQIAAFTVRNIDSAVYIDNIFFLEEVAGIVAVAKDHGLTVIAGGASCDADYEGVIDYLNADYLIYGPGENALPLLLDNIEAGNRVSSVINGWKYGISPGLKRYPMKHFDYDLYFKNGGITGFQTGAGCAGKCHFCFESSKPLMRRSHDLVVDDIAEIIKAGYIDFHLADAEFNQSVSESENFLKILHKRLTDENLTMHWAPYMRPAPVSGEMFDLFAETGVNLITLSVESSERMQKGSGYSYDDISFFLKLAGERDIPVAVDMLSGAPGEKFEELEKAVGFFRSNPPRRVGISTGYRIYRNTGLYRYLAQNFEEEKKYIDFPEMFHVNLTRPVFYQRFTTPEVKKIITGDSLFSIEGEEKGVNYQRTVPKVKKILNYT